MSIPGLRGMPPGTLAKRSIDDFLRDDLLTYAAALSYHLILAIFPFLIFLVSLLGFLNLSELFDVILEQARRALPSEAYGQVADVLKEVETGRKGGLLSFGILASIWFASIGIRSTMNALNKAYEIREDRSRMERYGLSIVYTVAFAALVILATVLFVLGPQLAAWAAGPLGLGEEVLTLWDWIRIPVALLLVMIAVSLVYQFAPNLDQDFRLVTPGSVFAVIAWALVSAGFQFYVANFGRYSVTYGSIGAVIVLLLYFFLSGSVLLMGGEINSVIQRYDPRPEDALPDEQPRRRDPDPQETGAP